MTKGKIIGIVLLVAALLEYFMAWSFLKDIVPFPESECYLHTINGFLRDAVILGALVLLYNVRKRIRDRVKRYFPIVVIGISYLCMAIFMITYLEMDLGFLTVLAIFTGLFNNIVLVLAVAMCYHHWPNKWMKVFYFLSYFITLIIMLFDALYFWTTSMHVESVVFKNMNIYSLQGIVGTTAPWQFGVLGALVILFIYLFKVNVPTKKKPNFAWSLLCLIVFGLGLNLSYMLLGSLVHYATDQVAGLDLEVEPEKTRHPARNMVVMPINVNFVHKALFDTDKVIKDPREFKERVLTDEDKRVLEELGIVPDRERKKPGKAQYDRIVMLVLESVHRDYIRFYNDGIPLENTPFIDSLLQKYPRMDHYYSSAIPTTQGLNSTFRSQFIYDEDLNGATQPSIFRQADKAGYKGIFVNASSRYYANEYREYPNQFGMKEYYAKEDLKAKGYKGASGWGFHNDVMYDNALRILEENKKEKLFLVVKTSDMHQPYPYYGIGYAGMPTSVTDPQLVTLCGMFWVDHTLHDFFEQAKAKGLMDDRTLFIITSDHNPHSGGEYKTIVKEEQDTQSIAPIPLIFVAKNLVPLDNIRTAEYASQEDLAPTLLSLMGAETPKEFLGRNLLESTDMPYALGYFGGKAYYYSEDRNFIATLDEAYPDTKEKDAIANYIMYNYVKRHLANKQY